MRPVSQTFLWIIKCNSDDLEFWYVFSQTTILLKDEKDQEINLQWK